MALIRRNVEGKMVTADQRIGNYFNYKGRRYYRIYLGGLSQSFALEKVKARRRLAPQFKWAVHKEYDGTYSVGRTIK